MQDFFTNCADILQRYGFSYLRGAGTTLLLALVERLGDTCVDVEEALQQEIDRYIQRCVHREAAQDSPETDGKDE